MSDNPSYKFCSREDEVSQSIAAEAQRMVFEAAMPVTPGKSIKAQLRDAARALGYRDGDWRIRAAWYLEAGCWSSEAIELLRMRYEEMQRKRCDAKARRQAKQETDFLKEQDARRAELQFLKERIARLETAARMAGER